MIFIFQLLPHFLDGGIMLVEEDRNEHIETPAKVAARPLYDWEKPRNPLLYAVEEPPLYRSTARLAAAPRA